MHIQRQTIKRFIVFGCLAPFIVAGAFAQPNAYVSSVAGNTVSVVNTATMSVAATIPVPTGPTGLAVSPDGSTVYVASQSANVVSVISTASNTIVGTISVGLTPTNIALNPNGTQLFVVEQGSNQVAVINTSSRAVVANITVGARPTGLGISPDGTRAYVTNLWAGTVTVIDTSAKAAIATFNAGSGPAAVIPSASGKIFVANEYDGTVTVHDSSGALLSTISGFTFPNAMALLASSNTLYVVNGNGQSVSAVNTASQQIVGTMAVGSLPTSIALSADGTQAFVTNEYGFSVSQISTANNTVLASPRIAVYPVGVALQPVAASTTPPACSYSLSTNSASFGTAGGSGTVNVMSQAGCAWTASSNAPWLSITSGMNGSGNGTVSFKAGPNGGTVAWTGTMTIAGQTFTVTESGLICSYALSSPSTSVGASGGSGSVMLAAPSGCTWTVTSDSGWLTVTSAGSGSGSATIMYSAQANSGLSSVTGNLTVGGQNFAVTEAGVVFQPIRVNSGGPQYTDPSGNVWAADNTRNMAVTLAPITNTTMPALYGKEAWSNGTLQYQFAVPNGSFTVKLHFSEFYVTQRGQRVFNIVINGMTVASNFDILAQTTAYTALDVSYPVTVSNGQITIQFVPVTGTPKVAAIEITQ